jgi:signal peptidase II
MKINDSLPKKLLPFIFSIIIMVADQLSKIWVIDNIPLNSIHSQFFGDFLRIIHVRNLGIAFSIGGQASGILRALLFLALPSIMIILMAVYSIFSKSLNTLQRYLLAGIIGGGVGNLIDRYLRPEGVVDFIDVKFYGLFGLERWPTFNIADSAIFVCGIFFAIYITFFQKGRDIRA